MARSHAELREEHIEPPGAVRPAGTAGRRLWEIDTARGLAVLAMLVFHFCWDWAYFHGGTLGGDWRYFSGAIAATFITLLGLSVSLDRGRVRAAGGSLPCRVAYRVALIGGSAALVTLGTWLVLPDRFVYFGILHLLALSTLLVALTARFGALVNALIGLAVLAIGWSGPFGEAPHSVLSIVGWRAPRAAVDWYPFAPWAGFAFLGLAVACLCYPAGRRRFRLPQCARQTAAVQFLGRHSLAIYLVHQIVLFPLVWLLVSL